MKIQLIACRKTALTFIHFNLVKNLLNEREFKNNKKNFIDVMQSDKTIGRAVIDHNPSPNLLPIYNDPNLYYIILYRHPIRSIAASYHKSVSKRKRKRVFKMSFLKFFNRDIEKWKDFIDKWILNIDKNINYLPLYMDDIIKNPTDIFIKISNFLNTKISILISDKECYKNELPNIRRGKNGRDIFPCLKTVNQEILELSVLSYINKLQISSYKEAY